MERMKDLIKRLNEAAKAYYNGNVEIMSDYEYDLLYDELVEMECRMGVVLSDSPTQRVGYEVLSGLKKVHHEQPMLSLDKTKDVERLAAFLYEAETTDRSCFPVGLLSWKMDGLTVALLYKDGELVQAATRGNGEIGEDITHNARVFKNIPLKIGYMGELCLRGEAVITFDEFSRINSQLQPEVQYKNPRNLCSGTVRQLNSEVVASRNVKFFVFTVLNAPSMYSKKSERLEWVRGLGFDASGYYLVTSDTVVETVEKMKNEVSGNACATDGLVLTYDSILLSQQLGRTSKFPKDSIAFKWADELAQTRLIEVQWNTSRTGLINPIAIFEPVELEGTTVNKASLHNVSIFEGLRLGRGDVITVYKANMIIPQIAENLIKSNTETIPKQCEVCGFKAEVIQANEGRALYCSNPNCRARLISALGHFASRDAMNIEGFSEASIEKFVECGFLDHYRDIYSLDIHAEQIKQMEGFGEKSVENLMSAIERSKSTRLPNFIHGLGINQVGLANARLLCNYFAYDLSRIRAAMEEELLQIPGFGGVIARSLCEYFSDSKNAGLLDAILPILKFEDPAEKSDQTLTGLTFVITGDLIYFKNRKELQEYIESSGGKVSGSVSGKTSYLINNDANSASSKNKKAMELNVDILTENQFRQKFMQ